MSMPDEPQSDEPHSISELAASTAAPSVSWPITAAIIVLACIATLLPAVGGLKLGDHEALVAQCARDMRVSGNWLVPYYLGEPYVRKPPLPYWLIAGLSYAFANDSGTGLPVTTTVARLPSAIAALGTVMLLWKLASFMFGRRVGQVCAVIAASSLCILLYAANATVEMILTFCCVWAHTHFWIGINQPLGSARRRVHMFFFYVALGMGMMAKGPFPLVMVALPIAVWWYLEGALLILAANGPSAWSEALSDIVQGIGTRTIRAFKEIWLIPGLIVFALCFVPWMVAVGMQHPHAWNLWNWQYFQRAQGRYEDNKPRGAFYYVPIILGLVLPWLFLLGEALIAPWIRKYEQHRRPLLYAGLWTVIGAVIMSAITFKKPYYVTPVIPGLFLLMAAVADRFYSSPIRRPKLANALYGVSVAAGIGAVIGGYFLIRKEMPAAADTLTAVAALLFIMLALAGLAFIRGQAWVGFGMTAVSSVLAFIITWQICAQALDNIGKVAALDRVLDEHGITDNVYWATRRPDSRMSFYFARNTRQMIQPADIVQLFVDRTANKSKLASMVMDRATELLDSPKPVYLILDRKEYWQAKMAGMRKSHLIGAAPDDKSEEKDWVVISNLPAR